MRVKKWTTLLLAAPLLTLILLLSGIAPLWVMIIGLAILHAGLIINTVVQVFNEGEMPVLLPEEDKENLDSHARASVYSFVSYRRLTPKTKLKFLADRISWIPIGENEKCLVSLGDILMESGGFIFISGLIAIALFGALGWRII